MTGRNIETRKFVAQILQRKFDLPGDSLRFENGLGHVVKEPMHLGRRLHMTLRIDREPATGVVELGVKTEAGENVLHLAIPRHRVSNAIGRENGETVRLGEVALRPDERFLTTDGMTLDFHADIALRNVT